LSAATERSLRTGDSGASSRWRSVKAPIRHIDLALLFAALGLLGLGLLAIYSATSPKLDLERMDKLMFVRKQISWAVLSLIGMTVVMLFDYHRLRAYAPAIYGLTILALLAVLSPLGTRTMGAQRWINIGSYQIQPSEYAKLVIVISLCALLSERRAVVGVRDVLLALAVAGVPMGLIYLQPDLGTLMVFGAVLMAVLVVAKVPARYMLVICAIVLVGIFGVVKLGLLKDYQKARLTAFVDPNADAQSLRYNYRQSLIAIGSGGPTGRGFLNGTQTNLDFVPEQHTDFINTVIGEEGGFAGELLLLGLFALIMWRGMRIATLSRDTFGTLLAAGVVSMFGFQMFLNIGMTVGIMPITGIPLPFVSYGGSSLLQSFLAIGLLESVHMRRFL